MQSSEIREKFLKYFESKGHTRMPGSSLVPKDPTVLLTLAGMLQFKPIFLGKEKPAHKTATTVQKCIRTIDIERVGKTARHHTFFEMLGNFSFGDYFKKEAIAYAWELLTRGFGIPADRLFPAVFEKDDEAYAIWKNDIGIEENSIYRLDEENNFWAAGPTGPCGPCSEIYYDHGKETGCGKPNCGPGCDCDRFLEIWNLVFIQYDRNEKGDLIPLKQRGIDTGMGLERIAAVLQHVDNNFKTDLFVPLIAAVAALSLQTGPKQESLQIVVDHIRAITFLISDGVVPENTGRGYILRRLIRRALRHGMILEIKGAFLHKLCHKVIELMKNAYPDLINRASYVESMIRLEEDHFLATLDQGLHLFKQEMKKHVKEMQVPGDMAFKLHDTYGFPIELTQEIAAESGCSVDLPGFVKMMDEQKNRGRLAGISSDKKALDTIDVSTLKPTIFEGYDKLEIESKVLAVFPGQKFVVLEKTCFYPEQGGQVGDTGVFDLGEKTIAVLDAIKTANGVIVHKVDNIDGLALNQKIKAMVDPEKRHAIGLNHTATHLLHKALQEVLGAHVRQAGSYVGPDKLRFDFTHFKALSKQELEAVEKIVNQKIREALKVETLQKNYHDAVKMGAMALFDEKYGDKVRVLKIGDYSLELCGGTHARSCGEILFFKILHESALGAGIRRIEAQAGQGAKTFLISEANIWREQIHEEIRKYKMLQMIKESLGGEQFTETGIFEIEVTELDRLSKAVDEQDIENVNKLLDHLKGRMDWLKERIAKAQKEVEDLRKKNVSAEAAVLAQQALEINNVKVVIKDFSEYSIDMLRTMSDVIRNKLGSCVVVLASVINGKVRFIIFVSDDLVAKGYSAKKLADAFCAKVGGKAGGKDSKVEGGANDPNRITEGFEAIKCVL